MADRRLPILPRRLGYLWFVLAMLFAPDHQAVGESSKKVQVLMSQAVTAYAAGKWNDAQIALQQALSLSTVDQKTRKLINGLLFKISQQKDVLRIVELLHQAQSAREVQDWTLALRLYKQVRGIDEYVKAGVEGVEYTTLYVEAHKHLQSYLSDPKVLFDSEARTRARKLLLMIREHGLRDRKIDEYSVILLNQIQKAEEPQTVYLTSDGESEITIYRVGVLGKFSEKSLLLKPGRYAAVAKRRQYQDVRHEFWVTPNETTRFDIRCSKSIFD